MRDRGIFVHEWIAGGTAVVSTLLLLLLFPVRSIADGPELVHRAVLNILNLAKIQLLSCLGIGLGVLVLRRWTWFRRHLTVTSSREIFALLLRATVPLLLMILFHQSIPLWQRIFARPEADASLIWLDERLFGGTNPVLWMEHITSTWLTNYTWAAYLSWFMAFQGTIYWLALCRKASEWTDMVLATVMTLAFGYIGYVLVPAVGPIHAMKAQFTVDLMGGRISQVTNGVVDQFGVWRDAFPSIHAAIAALLTLYVWRYERRWAIPYTVLGVSIIISTVYLRWHYVTDVIAGVSLAMACAWLSPRLIAWSARRKEKPSARAIGM